MLIQPRNWMMAAALGLLVACGGGGGGDRASGVEPGPPPSGGAVPPPPPVIPDPQPAPYAEQEVLLATITEVRLDEDDRPIVEFQLTNEKGTAILDLGPRDVRFTIAKLQASPLGNLTGSWQSYINRIRNANPDEGPGTEPRLQATYERDAYEGAFTNNGDGSYQYYFEQSLSNLPEDILAQAEAEGLDLSFEPDRTHRLVAQFSNSEGWANPIYNWVPATGETSGIFTMDIAATENCNSCHDPLRFHGGGRREVGYCVTCHNPGSTDPTNVATVDMKVMIHKIHMGADLPSVEAGGSYRVGDADYSTLGYPQDIRNCVNCHAGTATGAGRDDLVLTAQGDNWAEYAYGAVCGSCHDAGDAATHIAANDDTDCASCHSVGGAAGSIADAHRILTQEARSTLAAEILAIDDAGPGGSPTVSFRVSNPETGEDYDILNDPVWQNSSSRLRVRFAWDTGDYHNTGNQEDNASSVAADAKADAVANGDGSFRVTAPIPLPDGSEAPGVAASGSGVAVIEGRAVMPLGDEGETGRVPLTNVHTFFSIDEPDGKPVPRRQAADIAKCQSCHVTIAFHGGSRADNLNSCVTCHNPRNTDLEDRLELEEPPADGLKEQSVDMKVMIHGIHAASIRETPYQVEDTVFDEDHIRYPGDLSNCTACHVDDGYTLPLADTVLGPTVDTGTDLQDPADDTVATPTAAVCSSCHDNAEAKAHMTSNGGNFSTTQAAIDSGEVAESCSVCHGEGRVADVSVVHNPR